MTSYRLLFAVGKYFPFGGMQRTFLRIARECATRGHAVRVLTGSWQGERPDGIDIQIVATKAWTNPGKNAKLAQAVRAEVQSLAYDCVVGFTKIPGLDIYYGGDPCLAAKLAETKSRWTRQLPRYRQLLQQERAVFGAEHATEILLIAHQEEERFRQHYGTPASRFHRLPPGIDRQRISGVEIADEQIHEVRRRCGLGDNGYLLLLVGSGYRTKGVDRAITAIGALPPAIRQRTAFLVIGDGKPARFQALAKRLQIAAQVQFMPGRPDVVQFYRSADLLIHPARTENTGTTLIEAMLCGLPVLATANCGFAFHVERAQAGLLCPTPFRQQELNALLHTMITGDRRAQWSANGRRYCASTELYSLVPKAVDIIINRAAANRSAR